MKTTETKLENVIRAARNLNAFPFRVESCNPKYDAQGNLNDRTHYADDSTLKYFGARILRTGISEHSLVYWLVESVSSKPEEPHKNKRFVAFDIFGACLTDRDSWHATTDAAKRAGMKWLSDYDEVGETAKTCHSKASRRIAASTEALSLLATA
jgi:hypothetical protein